MPIQCVQMLKLTFDIETMIDKSTAGAIKKLIGVYKCITNQDCCCVEHRTLTPVTPSNGDVILVLNRMSINC